MKRRTAVICGHYAGDDAEWRGWPGDWLASLGECQLGENTPAAGGKLRPSLRPLPRGSEGGLPTPVHAPSHRP